MKKICLILLAAALASSCVQKGTNLERVPIFKVVPEGMANAEGKYEIEGRGGSAVFRVMSTGLWSASISGDEGFSLSDKDGSSGRTDLSVSAQGNTGSSARSTRLSILVDGEVKETFDIVQPIVLPYVEVTPEEVSLMGEEEEFTLAVDAAMEWSCSIDKGSEWLSIVSQSTTEITFKALENGGSENRIAEVGFYLNEMPLIGKNVIITQNFLAPAPKADLLDVVFTLSGDASDASAMKIPVEKRSNPSMGAEFIEKYNRYAAVFNPGDILSGQADGYYVADYTTNEEFKSKIADGYTLEVLFCRSDEPGTKQIKPFSSTQAGGTGICFRAKEGNEINFETHVGGSWVELYSGITPQKDVWYHAIGVWDKTGAVAKLYVDGKLTTSKTTTGDFKFMTTNEKYWFGIGADPNTSDQGEATFSGKVAIARLYDKPLSDSEIFSLWREVR